MSGADSPTLHQVLKRETAVLHLQAEAAMDLDRRLESNDAYLELIRTLWRLHSAHAGVPGAATRTDWLARDIAVLGGSPPPPATPVARSGAAATLGARYVLEGSALGGRVILKLARSRLGVTPQTGGRFLFGHGDATAAHWKAFVLELNAAPMTWREACLQGARKTFRSFIAELGLPAPTKARADT